MSKRQFTVAVIAPMSSGKSTLLNAMLGVPLLPSKNEACTAIVTKIRDIDGLQEIRARVKAKNGDYSDWVPLRDENDKLISWNNSKNSEIEIEGDFPHIDNHLRRIEFWDTPGPNNSSDKSHAEISHTIINNSAYSFILFVMNATQFGVHDERILLDRLLDELRGKSRHTRIIFALNKTDQLDTDNSEFPYRLTKTVKSYLYKIGFIRPNVIPVMSLLSLDIRRILQSVRENVELPFSSRAQRRLAKQIEYILSKEKIYHRALLNTKKKGDYYQRASDQERKINQEESIEIGGVIYSIKDLIKADILTGIPMIEEILEVELIKQKK
jgi:GTPase Era involved in 16S rRNA processing